METPCGPIGSTLDLRGGLVEGALEVAEAFGHGVSLGSAGAGVAVHFDTWTAHGEVQGLAVSVVANPRGATVSWEAAPVSPTRVRVVISVTHGGETRELTGHIDGAGATFERDA